MGCCRERAFEVTAFLKELNVLFCQQREVELQKQLLGHSVTFKETVTFVCNGSFVCGKI
jgi:hypothetical protein